MEQRRYEFLLRAERAVCQAEGTEGNHTHIMTRKMRLKDGSVERVPIVTADAARHQLREAAALATLSAAGMLGEGKANLTTSALRMLFAGGMLTGKGDPSNVKLDELRKLVEFVPSLGLFGGCVNSQMIAGQIQVSDMVLLCTETLDFAPEWIRESEHAKNLLSWRDYLDEEQRVRFDPEINREKQRLLAPGARDFVERKLEAKDRAHDEDNAVAKEAAKSTMLPRTCEVIIPGVLFYWEVEATTWNALELDTLHVALKAALSRFRIGGKQGTKHGVLRAVAMDGSILSDPSTRAKSYDLATEMPKTGSVFFDHVTANAAKVRESLAKVEA